MTATVVDGVAVIADEPTASPITDNAGRPVLWQRLRTLLLEDGRTVYGCGHDGCTYTNPNMMSIRPHQGAHRDRARESGKNSNGKVDAKGLSLRDLLSKVDQIDALVADRDAWKQRAMTAERSLSTLRRALRP